jgi:hypothetical protein
MDADTSIRTTLKSSQLGGPRAADPTLCSACVIGLLADAAGEGMRMASLALDITSNGLGERLVEVTVRIDKRARSIVFASAEARAGDDLVFTAQGLFSRAS